MIGDLVSFNINEMPNKNKPNTVYRVAVNLQKVNQDVLNEQGSTKVVLKKWARSRGYGPRMLRRLLLSKGIEVDSILSKVSVADLKKITQDINEQKNEKNQKKQKKQKQIVSKVQKEINEENSTLNKISDDKTTKKDSENDLISGLKKFFTTYF